MNLLSDKDKAVVGIDDVKLSHAVFAVEKVTDLVAVSKVGNVRPEQLNPLDLQIN